jgi:hypothetical protein
MPTIPSHHSVGDTGHTTDHNSIVDVLTDHELRITNVQTAQTGALLNSGQNTINVANPSGYAMHVVIPSGTRDNTAYVHTVTYGGKQTFGLDTFGQPRVSASAPGNVPMEIAGYDTTQTADLLRLRQGSTGTIVTRVGPDGTVYAPNVTPSAWTNITLSSGIVAASSTGATPQYRITGDVVMLRGSIGRSGGAAFSTSPTTLGSLPSGASPISIAYFIVASTFSAGYAWSRIQISSSGAIQMYFADGSGYNPTWINLDGIFFVVRS